MYIGHMTTAAEIADRVESRRKTEGRSVAWLSATTGIADKTLRRRLAAPDHFTLAELGAIAGALHATIEDFLADTATAKEDAAA